MAGVADLPAATVARRTDVLPRRRTWPVLAIFLLSGAAGLVYEVVWARQLVLVFGNTTQAVSAILTGYFGGLAIGSVLGGRLADRVRSRLRLYGLLELALVAVVLVTPLLFRGIHDVYRAWFGALESSPTALALVRYVLALAALAPATILMGATLPTLSRHLSRSGAELSGSFARLYAMNTLGAVMGTMLAGFVLIELFGLTMTLAVGAAASAIAGLSAIALSRSTAAESDRRPSDRGATTVPAPPGKRSAGARYASVSTTAPPAASVSPTRSLGLAVAFVSGLTSLGYQVLWNRLLSSGSGNTTYVFTVILAIFLVGLAAGAALFGRIARTPPGRGRLVRLLAVSQLVIAVLALAGLPMLGGMVDVTFAQRTLAVVLPTTIVLGLTLPLASALVAGDGRHVGRDAGLLLGVNTAGAICGTFLVPFVLIPVVGSPRSVALIACINAAVAAVLLARAGARLAVPRPAAASGATLVAVLAAGLLAIPNPIVVQPGDGRFGGGRLVSSTEDEIAAVQAGVNSSGDKQLLVAGTGMTTLTVDARLMTLLPLIARPSSQDLLVIAFGMGSSWRTGLVAGLRADAVELVPSVPPLFTYFHPDAPPVDATDGGRVIVADGRNYVELTDRRYDLVVVDPPPPIESSGTAILYSREFYEASARRLTPGGVMMEWMPHGQSVDEFRAHVRTFASVFPHLLLGFGPAHFGMYMLGSTEPIALDPSAIRSVLARPGVVADLSEPTDAPVHSEAEWEQRIPSLVWLTDADVRRFAGPGPLITDDRPLPEYFLLRRTFGPPSPQTDEQTLRAAAGGG